MSNRVYYAVQRAVLCRSNTDGSNDFATSGGYPGAFSSLIQSVGVSTSLDYEQLFELGRLQIFNNIEGIPSVEITVERALAVYNSNAPNTPADIDAVYASGTLWNMAGGSVTAAGGKRFNLMMEVSDDVTLSREKFVYCTGLYMNNYTLNFNLEGASTESATFVGNHIDWNGTSTDLTAKSVALTQLDSLTTKHRIAPFSGNADVTGADNAQQGGASIIDRSTFTSASGIGLTRLQSVTFSVSMDREDLLALGSKTPYYKAANFPVETTLEIEYYADKDDNGVDIEQNKIDAGCDVGSTINNADVKAGNRTFTFGTMNWTGTSYSGGDAGGGNATITYSYQGFNYHAQGVNTDYTTRLTTASC